MTGGPVTFTLDVEDYTAPGSTPRAVETTRQILAFLAERSVRGTFFVVGEFAEEQSALVREIADGGHEIGLHSYRHAPLTDSDPDTFRREVGAARAHVEDLAGRPVVGYRAPTFSIVPSTVWVTDILPELGFRYSSSVLPARSPLYGFPGRPRIPSRWPSGLLELPCPVDRRRTGHQSVPRRHLLPGAAVDGGTVRPRARGCGRGAVGVLPPLRLRPGRAVPEAARSRAVEITAPVDQPPPHVRPREPAARKHGAAPPLCERVESLDLTGRRVGSAARGL